MSRLVTLIFELKNSFLYNNIEMRLSVELVTTITLLVFIGCGEYYHKGRCLNLKRLEIPSIAGRSSFYIRNFK
jgi:hypothetical protein